MNTPMSASMVYSEMEKTIFGNLNGTNPAVQGAKALSKTVFDLSSNFLKNNKMVKADFDLGSGMQTAIASMASINGDVSMAHIGREAIASLVDSASVPKDKRDEAIKAVAVFLAKLKACAGNDELYRTQHFTRSRESMDSKNLKDNMSTFFAPSLHGVVTNIGIPSAESFGVNIDKVLPDIRASLAVTLLQFHRGIIDRIMHRRTSASPYVKYVVPYSEVYDMLKSNDADHKTRNEGDHIIPFIDLYGDPRVVSNQLQPIIPLAANDTEGVLYSDGYVKVNCKANLFDLSRIANQLGKTHYNFTDLVSENVVLNDVLLELTKDGKTEVFSIPMLNVNGSRLQMQPNTKDSGIRACMVDYTARFDNQTKTVTGATSELLKDCSMTDFLRVNLKVGVTINLKYSDVSAMGYIDVDAYNSNKAQVSESVRNLVEGLTVRFVAYSVDARYSEENLRKSNLAIRHHVRTFDFEISNGRNILIDYSFEEELPEFLMSLVTEATSLGQDHRAIDIIIKELMHVYDVTNEENRDPAFRSRLDKVGFQYVASQLVRPVVYLNTIDLDNVDTIRSSDVLGDIRQYVEWELLNLVSLIYQNSYYKHQLKPGEKPVFKCFTSSIILENLLSIPHIHNHLVNDPAVDGSSVEYRRVLPNGTILDCVTCTYNYMRDKIVMIPYRESDPEDVLNWGHNWDFGTFVAHYNPQIDNGVNKRLFSNTRTLPIPTNPMGLYLDVRGISKVIDMFQITAPTGSKLPQPTEIIKTA